MIHSKTTLFSMFFILSLYSYGQSIQDHDFDGVPDAIDQCMNTPFLNQVDEKGCTTKILKLPYETETNSLTVALQTGHSTNSDLIGRQSQYTTTLRTTYYYNTWSFTFRSGYYIHKQSRGNIDTTLRIKKRFEISSRINLNLSASAKLPTYKFKGNKTDYTLAASLSYYPSDITSFFIGAGHTWIHDKAIVSPIQDTNYIYVGTGYFFSKKLYGNLSYTYAESKFKQNYASQSLGTTLYYQINDKWFTTFSYSREFDEDLHDVINISIGYKVW